MAQNFTPRLDKEVCGPFCSLDSAGKFLTAPGNIVLTGTKSDDPLPETAFQWRVTMTATRLPGGAIMKEKPLCEVGLAPKEALERQQGKEGFLYLTEPYPLTVLLSIQNNNDLDAAVFYEKKSICTKTLTRVTDADLSQGGKVERALEFRVGPRVDSPNRCVLIRDVTGDCDLHCVHVKNSDEELWPVFLVGLNNGAQVSLTL